MILKEQMEAEELFKEIYKFVEDNIDEDEIVGLYIEIQQIKLLVNYILDLKFELKEADELTEKYFAKYMKLRRY